MINYKNLLRWRGECVPMNCFLCKGPHFARDWSIWEKRASLITLDNIEEKELQEETRLGALWSLSSIQNWKAKKKGLMFAYGEAVGKQMQVLINASNLFMTEAVAEKMMFCLEKRSVHLNTLSSGKIPACGVIHEVWIKMRIWSSKEMINIVPLDNYDFVIGMNIFDRITSW